MKRREERHIDRQRQARRVRRRHRDRQGQVKRERREREREGGGKRVRGGGRESERGYIDLYALSFNYTDYLIKPTLASLGRCSANLIIFLCTWLHRERVR